jgi:putative ABC transport system permease protein
VHERTREIGLLRAVGATRRQLRAVIRWESVLTAGLGTMVGAALGVFLGWGLVHAAGSAQGAGVFSLPYGRIAIVLVVGAVAGLLAAIRPARRAARLDVLTAIATE